MFIGTIVNVLAIILGGSIGLIVHNKFPDKIRRTVFAGIGLCVLSLGMQMSFKTANPLIPIFSMVIGGIIGELIDIETKMERLGEKLKRLVSKNNTSFTEGFVTASLLFCVGSMGILGSISEGIHGDHSILFTKAIIDGFSAIVLAASLGSSVILAAVPVLLYQGLLTLFVKFSQGFFTPPMINEITAVGGLMIIGIGINLLEIKKIKVINFLPSLLIAIAICLLISSFSFL